MAEYLPLFPLNSVVFPGETLRLYIFEPRYKQLIKECSDQGNTFGIPPIMDNQVVNIFTEVELSRIDRTYEGGEMDIHVKGIRRAKILRYDEVAPGKLYPGGEIAWLDSDERGNPELQELVFNLFVELNNALGFQRVELSDLPQLHSFGIGHQVGLTPDQECKLLGMDSEAGRLSFLRDHLRKILPTIKKQERNKVKAKMNGHFKDAQHPDY